MLSRYQMVAVADSKITWVRWVEKLLVDRPPKPKSRQIPEEEGRQFRFL